MIFAFKRAATRARVVATLLLVMLASLGAIPAQAATAQFVVNGNFTNTTLSSPGGYICKVGSTCTSNVANWTSTCNRGQCGTGETVASLLFAGTSGTAFNNGNSLWGTIPDAPGGGNTIAIDGDPYYSASISQSITGLIVGGTYTLGFEQAAAQQYGLSGNTTERWAVTFGGTTQNSTLMINPSHGVQPWNLQTMTFVANSTSEVLTFLSVGTPAGEPPVSLLSNVSLTGPAVPEPTTWAMMFCGFGIIGGLVRRRMIIARMHAA